MKVLSQHEIERGFARKWLDYVPDEDFPTATSVVLMCDSCGRPVPKAVALPRQTVCRTCLKQALELLEEQQ